MALFGGIYYWFPKVTGRFMDETMGKIQFWLYMIGFNVTFFPMHFLGVQGMPRRNYTYAVDQGWDLWNWVASVGAYATAVGGIVFAINFFWSLKKGAKAEGDAWNGRTLEWTIPSPPHEYNFGIEPTVTRTDDFWYQKYSEDGKKLQPPKPEKYDPNDIHLPGPSYWPIILAAGITVAASGFFVQGIGLYVSLLGIAVVVVSVYGWSFEEA